MLRPYGNIRYLRFMGRRGAIHRALIPRSGAMNGAPTQYAWVVGAYGHTPLRGGLISAVHGNDTRAAQA